MLAESVAGELIDTEIEIRSGPGRDLRRGGRSSSASAAGACSQTAGGSGSRSPRPGTHPWANYLDQRIIDTEHYNRLREELRWVAQRNNTWSLHVHVGVRGADRAIAVCDHLRGLLPPLLALSANSPFLDGQDTGLHSVRTEIFTRTFPRCGVHEPFGDWDDYADFIDLLDRHRQRSSSRPSCGGACARTTPSAPSSCGSATPRPAATRRSASPALITACIAQSALDYDDGRLGAPLRQREIEENLWQAIRHGLDGTQIDFGAGEVIETRAALERLVEWTAPAREALGIEVELPDRERRPAGPAKRSRTARRWPTSTASRWPRPRPTYPPGRARLDHLPPVGGLRDVAGGVRRRSR